MVYTRVGSVSATDALSASQSSKGIPTMRNAIISETQQ